MHELEQSEGTRRSQLRVLSGLPPVGEGTERNNQNVHQLLSGLILVTKTHFRQGNGGLETLLVN